jgi:hypothetical protein
MNSKLTAIALVITTITSLTGCSEDTSKYPSSEGKAYPFILKNGCEFAIVEELSRSSVTSPQASGVPDSWVTASVSLGDHSISVSNCEVVDNPSGLPIYEN